MGQKLVEYDVAQRCGVRCGGDGIDRETADIVVADREVFRVFPAVVPKA